MDDGGLARESLASFLQDVPRGAHAACILGLADEAVLAACRDEARDAREQLALLGFAGAAPDSWDLPAFDARAGSVLGELAQRARRSGHRGLLVVVRAAASVRGQGVDGHLAGERAVGPAAPEGVRVLCVYTREDVARPELRRAVGDVHAVLLRAGAGAPPGGA